MGPADNYAGVSTFARWVLILDMLLIRLEIYTGIILLVPRFYKKELSGVDPGSGLDLFRNFCHLLPMLAPVTRSIRKKCG